MIFSRLHLWGLLTLGSALALGPALLAFNIWLSGVKDTAFEAGQLAERTIWTEQAKARELVIDDLLQSVSESEDTLHRIIRESESRVRAAEAEARDKIAKQQATIARLQGEIDATPILKTVAAGERLPDVRVQQHARADADLAAHRRDYPDAAGASGSDRAALDPVPLGTSSLAATGGLTLGGTERRAAQLAAALAATESRYIALWEFAQENYRADLARWEAEQIRRAAVAAIAPD